MYDVHQLAVYLRWLTDDWAPADTHAWPRIFEQEVDSQQPTDGRGCREKWRGDRLEMYDHGRLPTLTDAYRRLPTLIPGAGLLLLPRVTVSIRTQCDWALSTTNCCDNSQPVDQDDLKCAAIEKTIAIIKTVQQTFPLWNSKVLVIL